MSNELANGPITHGHPEAKEIQAMRTFVDIHKIQTSLVGGEMPDVHELTSSQSAMDCEGCNVHPKMAFRVQEEATSRAKEIEFPRELYGMKVTIMKDVHSQFMIRDHRPVAKLAVGEQEQTRVLKRKRVFIRLRQRAYGMRKSAGVNGSGTNRPLQASSNPEKWKKDSE
ncbi:hypothetical protein EW146_g3113 [Bondarzewia mesenterica]|uniref:Uncharacterized protein n=1 Tax=Bondarzewia mesenterica TaxID=1095465 RepID=A0A4S4M0V4_9AGAM|nr:hypothetical protein EW146_g3113 [Bondarzewia mesenterica]